jgi:hypothetical protein
MRVQIDLTRNSPDFILAREGAPMQDPRFVLLHSISYPRFFWTKLVIWLYDRCKDWFRKQEDLERRIP